MSALLGPVCILTTSFTAPPPPRGEGAVLEREARSLFKPEEVFGSLRGYFFSNSYLSFPTKAVPYCFSIPVARAAALQGPLPAALLARELRLLIRPGLPTMGFLSPPPVPLPSLGGSLCCPFCCLHTGTTLQHSKRALQHPKPAGCLYVSDPLRLRQLLSL